MWNEIRFWDIATKKQIAHSSEPIRDAPYTMVFSPDGKRAIWPDLSRGLALRHPLTGKQIEWLDKSQFLFRPVIFSPNGKTLITSGDPVRIWELATLQERYALALDDRPFATGGFAVSPDGGMLATSSMSIDLWETINLWDLSTGKEIGRLVGHPGPSCLAFSHDGRLLVSGSEKHGCLVWDLQKMVKTSVKTSVQPTSQEIDNLWEELRVSDAPRAFKAIRRLVTYADTSIDLISKRIQPVKASVPISQFIHELESDDSAVREKAFAELEKLGDWIKPKLREELQKNSSTDFQTQVNKLLANPPSVTVPPEHLRDSRALEVLEFIGTPGARRVVENLASGAPEARLTQDAKATLARLSRNQANP
jgi:WD40 repeat protein